MAKLTPEFSATRAIREYTESHYLPAASRYHDRAADDGAIGTGLLQWKQDLERHWNTVHFVRVRINTHDGQHFFQADVTPGSLTPDHLRVELYADSAQGESACFEAMIASGPSQDTPGSYAYSAQVSGNPACVDHTARISPQHSTSHCRFRRVKWFGIMNDRQFQPGRTAKASVGELLRQIECQHRSGLSAIPWQTSKRPELARSSLVDARGENNIGNCSIALLGKLWCFIAAPSDSGINSRMCYEITISILAEKHRG